MSDTNEQLLDHWIDGCLSDSDQQQLQRWLEQSPDHMLRFVEANIRNQMLKNVVQTEMAAENVFQAIAGKVVTKLPDSQSS